MVASHDFSVDSTALAQPGEGRSLLYSIGEPAESPPNYWLARPLRGCSWLGTFVTARRMAGWNSEDTRDYSDGGHRCCGEGTDT
jgi:hypothetical protein